MTGDIFHLAIPTHDLDAALIFYRDVMGAVPARRYADRQTFCFFGHQLVCHLDSDTRAPDNPLAQPYPRHFGMTLAEELAIENVFERCAAAGLPHLSALSWRFAGKPERHRTFWVADPAGNVLEFKWYPERRYVY
jgi:extradiol dioxygenase family protein